MFLHFCEMLFYDIVVGRTDTSLVATGYEAKQYNFIKLYTPMHTVCSCKELLARLCKRAQLVFSFVS